MIGKTYHSRILNSKRNAIAGMVKQCVTVFFTFALRTVLIHTLGANFQGLGSLFGSIFQVLNMSELGFSTAITFILYKPIADGDIKTVNAIVLYLKKVYLKIGTFILLAGIAIIPFLNILIVDDYPENVNIYIIYVIYLFNIVVSYYLFAYKSTLLTAMQRVDIVNNTYTITSIVLKALQIMILMILKNYYAYIIVLPICSIANNLLLEYYARKLWPDLSKEELDSSVKKDIFKHVKSVFINRMGDIARNSFDNIVLSAYFGLVVLTAYDNYYCIYAALYGVMGIIIQAFRSGVGNSLVKEDIYKNFVDMKRFTFAFMWIVGWCTICLVNLYQPFMNIWMHGDNDLILSDQNMLLFCFYFYSISMTYTKNLYLEAKGLFYESRYLYIAEALCNLSLNIILGKLLGVTGLLLATILTILLFNFFGGTQVLFREYFKFSAKPFYAIHFKYFIITLINCLITYGLCMLIKIDGIRGLMIRSVLCLVFSNLFYFVLYRKNEYFEYLIKTLKNMISLSEGKE